MTGPILLELKSIKIKVHGKSIKNKSEISVAAADSSTKIRGRLMFYTTHWRGNMAIYGYCRVSTHSQRIERQETNIRERYPQAVIYKEAFTGTKLQGRKELDKILRRVNPGDTIVFDEVSRMSRNAEEGFALYKELFYKNINNIIIFSFFCNV